MAPEHFTIGAYTLEGALLSIASPLALAVLTFFALPVCLAFSCWRNGTLFLAASPGNPGGHGLVSAINSYLLLTAPINYAIFSYYQVYEYEIGRLYSDGVLLRESVSFFVTAHKASGFLTATAYVVAVALAVLSIYTPYRRRPAITNWLAVAGRPRPVSYYFHVVFFTVQLSIVFNWFLQHIVVWWTLGVALRRASSLDALHPDHMLGLSALTNLSWWTFIVMSLIALLVALWLVGGRITLRHERFDANPGHPLALAATSLCSVLVILVPLVAPHSVMYREKRKALEVIAAQARETSRTLTDAIRRDQADTRIEKLSLTLEVMKGLYSEASAATTWPISQGTLTAVPLGVLSPLLVPVVELGLQQRRRRATRKRTAGDSTP